MKHLSRQLATCAFACALSLSTPAQDSTPHAEAAIVAENNSWVPSLELSIRKIDRNLVDDRNPGMAGVKYGAEGGEVVRDAHGVYHWFTSEQVDDPYWMVNRIAHWTSKDGLKWTRDNRWAKVATADNTGVSEKSSYFDPTVVFDESTGYWYLFYVAWRNSPEKSYHLAKIFRAKSMVAGREGLGGPYHDNDADDVVVMSSVENPGPYEKKWVGDSKSGYGAATVTIYQARGVWYMIWVENLLATAPSPGGKFTRLPEGPLNPITFNREPFEWPAGYMSYQHPGTFSYENPIVMQIPEGRPGAGTYLLLAGYYWDASIGVEKSTCGYATSDDGVRWSEFRPLRLGSGECFTILSFLPEKNGSYSMFITDRDEPRKQSYERMSRVEVSVVRRTANE